MKGYLTLNNNNQTPRRIVETKQQLEELIMDITSSDLNRQMQQLITEYKKTGNEHYKLDAEYLRSEFDTWWNDEVSLFAPPAQIPLVEFEHPAPGHWFPSLILSLAIEFPNDAILITSYDSLAAG